MRIIVDYLGKGDAPKYKRLEPIPGAESAEEEAEKILEHGLHFYQEDGSKIIIPPHRIVQIEIKSK